MEVPTAQKSDREVAYGGPFIFGKNAILHFHRQML